VSGREVEEDSNASSILPKVPRELPTPEHEVHIEPLPKGSR
jgi:hypothetical protein